MKTINKGQGLLSQIENSNKYSYNSQLTDKDFRKFIRDLSLIDTEQPRDNKGRFIKGEPKLIGIKCTLKDGSNNTTYTKEYSDILNDKQKREYTIFREMQDIKLMFPTEEDRCKESMLYYYNNYLTINGSKIEKLTQEEFNQRIAIYERRYI